MEAQHTLEREHQKAHEFYKLILSAIEKLSALQQILMSMRNISFISIINSITAEFLDIHALLFYALSSVLAFFVTTTAQTHSARFWLFMGLPAFFGIELLLRAKAWDPFGIHIYCALFVPLI